MSSPIVRTFTLCSFMFGVLTLAPALAAETSSIPVTATDSLYPHVRTNEPAMAALLRHASADSRYFNELVERLNNSNLVVYVRSNQLLAQALDGQLTFMGTAGGRRYVVVSLAWGRSELRLMATLGHELRHAVEIAERPEIVDRLSMAKGYAAFGEESRGAGLSYETPAAIAAGERVWTELIRKPRNVATRELAPEARP